MNITANFKRLRDGVLCTIVLLLPIVGFADCGARVGKRFATGTSADEVAFKQAICRMAGVVLGGIIGIWFCGILYKRLSEKPPEDKSSFLE